MLIEIHVVSELYQVYRYFIINRISIFFPKYILLVFNAFLI